MAQSVRDRLKRVSPTSARLQPRPDPLYSRTSALSIERIALQGPFRSERRRAFAVWTTDILRPTRDLDLLGFGNSDLEEMCSVFAEIVGSEVPDDGVVFNVDSRRAGPIRAEQAFAEKLQAIVALGQTNSGVKDFYDLLALSRLFAFEGRSLTQAIRATFERRETPLPTEKPLGLSNAFAEDSEKARQWSAFVRREPLLL
jgi:Nucleotidyl transferase AbiEii toxin, Type IV TA system